MALKRAWANKKALSYCAEKLIKTRGMIVIRAFIGIEFDSVCKKYIYELQQRLKKYAVKGRWKSSDNFHLTLKFLDEINAKQQKQIDEAMLGICAGQNPFRLEITGLGAFSGRESIRVVWLGLSGNLHQLQPLAVKIENSMAKLGYPPEKRPYSPHITIGQDIIFECPFDQMKGFIEPIKFGPIDVNKVVLFKSEQIQNKRVYSKISDYPLRRHNA